MQDFKECIAIVSCFQQEIKVSRFFPEAKVYFRGKQPTDRIPYANNELYYLMALFFSDLSLERLPYLSQVIFTEEYLIVESDEKQRTFLHRVNML